jgi:ATP-binding cassette, subfamily F, member 3
MQAFVDRFRAKASKARQAQSRLKMLERMEPIARGRRRRRAADPLPRAGEPPLSPPIVALEGVASATSRAPVLKRLTLSHRRRRPHRAARRQRQRQVDAAKLIAGRLEPPWGGVTRAPS